MADPYSEPITAEQIRDGARALVRGWAKQKVEAADRAATFPPECDYCLREQPCDCGGGRCRCTCGRCLYPFPLPDDGPLVFLT